MKMLKILCLFFLGVTVFSTVEFSLGFYPLICCWVSLFSEILSLSMFFFWYVARDEKKSLEERERSRDIDLRRIIKF